ncbi:MAG: peptidylprolyl isomerase fpr4 [Icmadophila ericetorum]|nr:peptidylprolyl isomerase fpr4 [Icmadophila ericetorum]
MAAIDPSAAPVYAGTANDNIPPRATLKLIRQDFDIDDDDDEDEDEDYMLNGDDEDLSEDDDEAANGGPSDPLKSKGSAKEAHLEQLLKAFAENKSESDDDDDDDDDEDMDLDGVNGINGINGIISQIKKGKGKATDEDEEDSDDDDLMGPMGLQEYVLCTLDPEKNCQQPLDITVGEDERVFFKVSGTHKIYLTGNYIHPDEGHDHGEGIYDSDEEDEYDMSPDEDELEIALGEEIDDELDGLENPRISEVTSEDDEEPPKLVKAGKQAVKGKNKRPAEETNESATLDDIMAKSLKPEEKSASEEPKLSKKQLKKLKNNAGAAVAAPAEVKNEKDVKDKDAATPTKDKKVQFAKNLEQGPSGKTAELKTQNGAEKKADSKTKDSDRPKAGLGAKMVQGVKCDDKKLGSGPAAKNGDKVGMRYIGKTTDGKVFDANKKGKPFTFTLGKGEVIKGWDVGIAGMSVGGERRITIPAALAYGKKAQPGIPANSELIFDVKLLEIR